MRACKKNPMTTVHATFTFSHAWKAPRSFENSADELTELYSNQLSAIEKLGIKIPPLWSMASSRAVELIAQLEKIRHAARALRDAAHNSNDSPETIRKIIFLEQFNPSLAVCITEMLGSLWPSQSPSVPACPQLIFWIQKERTAPKFRTLY